MPIKEKTVLMDGVSIDRALVRISHQILEKNTDDAEDICLLGIKTRGEFLAERIADNIENII
ncbi:MAG: bifunctional pyr operon transcriptional regulator/uracil phosphoribosyltransferase, partial [Oscillospiraceae bacterium]|nr:bifunctional pyr operon transcriptional regulator/uracil phosphoribosyltransferase [Oscillospiraceae bacterium]